MVLNHHLVAGCSTAFKDWFKVKLSLQIKVIPYSYVVLRCKYFSKTLNKLKISYYLQNVWNLEKLKTMMFKIVFTKIIHVNASNQ